VRGRMEVVIVWMREEVDVVVLGGPETDVRIVSRGEEGLPPWLEAGRRERKVREGYVVVRRVWETASSALHAPRGHTLITFAFSYIGTPHSDIILLETPYEFGITKDIPLKLFIVLVLSANEHHQPDPTFFPYGGEEVSIRSDPEFGQSTGRRGTSCKCFEIADKG